MHDWDSRHTSDSERLYLRTNLVGSPPASCGHALARAPSPPASHKGQIRNSYSVTEAVIGRPKTGADTAFAILAAVTFCHLLNDLATSLLPAIYPILESGLDLTFGQIGLLTFVYQGVASLLQPVVGLFTARRP